MKNVSVAYLILLIFLSFAMGVSIGKKKAAESIYDQVDNMYYTSMPSSQRESLRYLQEYLIGEYNLFD